MNFYQSFIIGFYTMKISKKIIIITVLLSIALLFTGFQCYRLFFNWVLPNVEGVAYQSNSVTRQFSLSLIYSLIIASIPVATILLWKHANIRTATKRILVPLILIFFLAATTIYRQIAFRADVLELAEYKQLFKEQNNEVFKEYISIDSLHIEKYMLFGLVAGIIVVFLQWRKRNKKR